MEIHRLFLSRLPAGGRYDPRSGTGRLGAAPAAVVDRHPALNSAILPRLRYPLFPVRYPLFAAVILYSNVPNQGTFAGTGLAHSAVDVCACSDTAKCATGRAPPWKRGAPPRCMSLSS